MSKNIFDLLSSDNCSELQEALDKGTDPNTIHTGSPHDSDFGITPIFLATINAELNTIKLLIKYGADVNYQVCEDCVASDVYAPTVLSLAKQCRFLINYEKYDPIVKLLESAGAINET